MFRGRNARSNNGEGFTDLMHSPGGRGRRRRRQKPSVCEGPDRFPGLPPPGMNVHARVWFLRLVERQRTQRQEVERDADAAWDRLARRLRNAIRNLPAVLQLSARRTERRPSTQWERMLHLTSDADLNRLYLATEEEQTKRTDMKLFEARCRYTILRYKAIELRSKIDPNEIFAAEAVEHKARCKLQTALLSHHIARLDEVGMQLWDAIDAERERQSTNLSSAIMQYRQNDRCWPPEDPVCRHLVPLVI